MLLHIQPLVKTEGETHVLPRKEGNGLELLTLLILLLVLALPAWRWGFDSSDGPLSPEWERRRWHDVDRQRRNQGRDEHPSQWQSFVVSHRLQQPTKRYLEPNVAITRLIVPAS